MAVLARKNNLNISYSLSDKQHIIGWGANSTEIREWIRFNPNKTYGCTYECHLIVPGVLNSCCRHWIWRHYKHKCQVHPQLQFELSVYWIYRELLCTNIGNPLSDLIFFPNRIGGHIFFVLWVKRLPRIISAGMIPPTPSTPPLIPSSLRPVMVRTFLIRCFFNN